MKKLCTLLGSAFAALAMFAAQYTLDLTAGARAIQAQAPVLRQAAVNLANGCKAPSSVAIGDTIDLTLFDDVRFSLKIVSAPPPGIAGQSFIARDENGSASAIVKINANTARISIDDFMNRRQYTVRAKDGVTTIVERDNSQAVAGECGTCNGEVEIPQPATAEEAKATSATKTRKLLGASGDQFPLAEQKSVVDILVAFDQGAKAWALRDGDGWDSLEDCAEDAVARMNDVLVNTIVNDVLEFRLVGVTEIDGQYDDITEDIRRDIRLGAEPFEKIPALRDYYGADTVTLLVNVDENRDSYTTGLSDSLTGVAQSNAEDFAMSRYGYNICHIQRTFREYTMAHETGHCMGAGHSNLNKNFSSPQSAPYSCGYHFIANGSRYRTVMGYSTSVLGGTWAAAPYFSSPDITPVEYGVKIGTETNDNRRVLRETSKFVSEYREHVQPYDWDVKFLDSNGGELRNGRIFDDSIKVTLSASSAYSAGKIYITLDGSTPDKTSIPYNIGATVTISKTTTITASIVVDGVAQSVRSITLVKGTVPAFIGSEGLVWETNGKYPWSTTTVPDWTNANATVLHNYNFDWQTTGYYYDPDYVTYLSAEIEGPKRLYFRHCSNFGSMSDGKNRWGRFSVVCEGGDTFTTAESSMVWRRDFVDIPSGPHRVTILYSQGQAYMYDSGVWLDDLQLVDNMAEVTLSPRDVTSFTDTISVSLSTDAEGQTIYYTTDGSSPTTSSNVYNGNLLVSGDTTIKACAVDGNGNKSAVFSSNYRTKNKDGINMGERLGEASRIWSNCPQNEWGKSGADYVLSYSLKIGALHNYTWLGTIVDGPKIMNFTYKTTFVTGSRFAVTIDGEEAMSETTARANDTTRSIAVPEGVHDVRFVYSQHSIEPTSTPNNFLFLKDVEFVDSVPLTWSGESGQNGNGRWMSDSTVLSWNDCERSYVNGLAPSVTFGNLSGNSSPTVTVKGEVVPGTVAFDATTTAYTFDKGDDNASIALPDANFNPSGNVTFNVPVKLEADSFTVAAGKTYTFNAPFGPNATSSSATFSPDTPIVVGAASTLTVAPGEGNTQTFAQFNNTGNFYSSAKFNVGEGTVVFTNDGNGNGLFGSIQVTASGGKLVFNGRDALAGQRNSNVNVENGGEIVFGGMENFGRKLNFKGGKVTVSGGLSYGRAFELNGKPAISVSADSTFDSTASKTQNPYVYLRDGSPTFTFANNATLVNNIIYADGRSNFANADGGINLSGTGTFIQNSFNNQPLTYVGDTSIGGGMTLALNAEHQNAGAYTVASGARLTGSGAITGNGVVTLDGSSAKLCGSLAVKNLKCASDSMFGDQWNPVSAVVTGSLSTKSDGASVAVNNGYLAIGADCDVSGFSTANLNIQDAGLLLSNSLTVASVSVNNSTLTIANGATLNINGSVSLDCSKLKIILENPDEEGAIPMLTANGGFANIDKLDISPKGYKAVRSDNTQLCYKRDPDYVEYQKRLPVVDILVAFDEGAQTYMGERSLEEFALTQIDKMNDILATNKLDACYSYRLAGVCKVSGSYDNIDTAPAMVSEGNGAAVTLRAMRELYGADTVTLLVNTSGATLGNSSPLSSSTDIAGCHDDAFSVCSIAAVDTGSQHTMIHENAHNMGCGHARAQSQANSPFSYGRGYYFMDGETKRHTIMAYDVDGTGIYAYPSPYFSTSSEEFGFALGDADNDNARVLRETCGKVATWRESVKPHDDEVIITDENGNRLVSGCVFKGSIKVTVTAPVEGAELYYTFGGDDPVVEEDAWHQTYSCTFTFTQDRTLKVAYLVGNTLSPVQTVKFFKRSNIPAEGLWQTSLKYPWIDDGEAIRSHNYTDYTAQTKKCTTPLKATVAGPAKLKFKHKSYFGGESVAGNNYSHFDVLLDDSPVLTQTECTNTWTDATIEIPDGTHEITFVFSQRFAMNNKGDYKDGDPEADDAVWLKDVAIVKKPVKTENNFEIPGTDGWVMLEHDDVEEWLEENNFDGGGTWQEFMAEEGANGYPNWKNFMLGYSAADSTQKFTATIEIKDGEVTIKTNEGTLPSGLGIVKRIFKKSKLEAAWDPPEGEVMPEKSAKIDAGDGGFYKVTISIEE